MTGRLHAPGLNLGGVLTAAGKTEAPEVQLHWPGLDPLEPCLDILIFDDSGSMTTGNDPVGNRYAEARRAVDLLATWTTSPRQKVTVIHFDYPSVDLDGPYRLDRAANRKQVLRSLAVPSGAAGSSELSPAMTAALRLAREHGGTTRCTIFSDFELADANPMQPYEQMREFPGAVHAVVLNAEPSPPLVGISNVTVTRITTASPPGLTAAALMHSLATGRRGARRPALRAVTTRDPG